MRLAIVILCFICGSVGIGVGIEKKGKNFAAISLLLGLIVNTVGIGAAIALALQ